MKAYSIFFYSNSCCRTIPFKTLNSVAQLVIAISVGSLITKHLHKFDDMTKMTANAGHSRCFLSDIDFIGQQIDDIQ